MNPDVSNHRIANTNFAYLDRGAYGAVFVDRAAGRVRKVFRNDGFHAPSHCADVFDAELDAYRRVQDHAGLVARTPRFFGTAHNFRIVGDGVDVTDCYHPQMTLELSFVQGLFQKVGSHQTWMPPGVRAMFLNAGIMHLSDVSVTFDDGDCPTYIDFATVEIEVWHTRTE